MRVAYCGFPHVGGTYSVFKLLHAGLQPRGDQLRWLGIAAGDSSPAIGEGGAFESELAIGTLIGDSNDTDEMAARRFCEHVLFERFDAVIVNVLASRIQMNAARYLDPGIARLMVVHSITPATYSAAEAIRDFVHGVIAISPRIKQDLVKFHGFSGEQVQVVPTGVPPSDGIREERIQSLPLRVIYVGRVSDDDKGVLWLPKIMEAVPPNLAKLTVIGDGADLPKLREQTRQRGLDVDFKGRLDAGQVREELIRSDVILMPSRFEGLGIALLEAMSNGVVPVASRIRGVTDFVSPHGETGLLFEVGDVSTAAAHIVQLAKDLPMLARMRVASAVRVKDSFGLEGMIDGYRDCLGSCIASVDRAKIHTISLDKWKYPRGLRPALRSRLPRWMKNHLRVIRERLRG